MNKSSIEYSSLKPIVNKSYPHPEILRTPALPGVTLHIYKYLWMERTTVYAMKIEKAASRILSAITNGPHPE